MTSSPPVIPTPRAPGSAGDFKTWDQYVEEAELPPFRLPVSADRVLIFEAPTGVALLRITQGLRSGDLELILRSLVGEQWDELIGLLGKASHKVLPAITEDMLDHFELYDPVVLVGPNGDKVTRTRPTDVRALLEAGYRPAGEARASS